jgi:membrane fusion protein (multidrug efflux system)
MRVGDTADVRIDTFPNRVFHGKVEQLSPASGSQFALLPPDNATGNFTKVVQRVPVKIVFFPGQLNLDRLRPGFSAVVTVHTGKAGGRSDGDQ